jgi:peptidyl-prolyl cis-trans isomerase B (cyclophilin B)
MLSPIRKFCSLLTAPLLTALIASVSANSIAADAVVIQLEKNRERLPGLVIEFNGSSAPAHVANFKKLVKDGFYDGLLVHRLIPGTMVQLGDPLSKKKDSGDLGTGGPGYTLNPEFGAKHRRGSVAMGRLSDAVNPKRLSNGSQFYIALRPLPELDQKYTVFAEVTRGLEVLDSLDSLAVDPNDKPMDPVRVLSAKIVPFEKIDPELKKLKTGVVRSWWNRILHPFRK